MQISSTFSSSGPIVTFDDASGIAEEVLSENDYVRFGRDMRRIVSLTEVTGKGHRWKSLVLDGSFSSVEPIASGETADALGTIVTFDNSNAVSANAVSVGDFVSFNGEIRRVTSIVTSGSFLVSFQCQGNPNLQGNRSGRIRQLPCSIYHSK